MSPAVENEREIQKSFWIEKTSQLNLEAMMLDSEASDLDKQDRPEVLSLLPSYEGKSVLELGAGIGRFTGDFAEKAGELVAVDFIEEVIKKNESTNGHHKNVKFMCADVTSPDLTFLPGSVDLIFSNWLLMYLSDEEVQDLAERMVKWLKVGGYIFFRETCFHQSRDHKGKNNPTHYREPRFYTKFFQECNLKNDAGKSYELSLIGYKCIETYVRNKRNQNEICWIWQKVRSEDDRGFQHFLDTVQYKSNGILRYERVFGPGFVSTGGIDTTKEFVVMLDLQPGEKVLDVGCGIGGGDFYMAEKYDVHVVGIDLSVNMISLAFERAIGHKCMVEFEVADCTVKTYPEGSFDVIYSRDTIPHGDCLKAMASKEEGNSSSKSTTNPALDPDLDNPDQPGLEFAQFAAGCFWGVELAFQRVEGVVKTEVGYSQGNVHDPNYKLVCSGTTEHAEVIRIQFDPNVCSYSQLLSLFWSRHDPTTLNRQGNDVGRQYRSGIYYYNDAQAQLARESMEAKQKEFTDKKIVTEILPAKRFYRAEEYHQQYLEKGGGSGCKQSAAKGCNDPIRCYG